VASASSQLIGRWLPRRRPAADHLPAYQALAHKPTSSSFPSAHTATTAAFTTVIMWDSPAAGLVVAPDGPGVLEAAAADLGELQRKAQQSGGDEDERTQRAECDAG